MFEVFQQRQRGPGSWKAFGVVAAICCGLVWGGLKLRAQAAEHDHEERHLSFVAHEAKVQHSDRVQLPGMSARMPAPDTTGDRGHGQAKATAQINGVFVTMELDWNAGAMPDAPHRRSLASRRAAALSPAFIDVTPPSEQQTSGSNSLYTFTYRTDYQTAIIGIGTCDGRVIELALAAPGEAATLFDRFVGDFRCTP